MTVAAFGGNLAPLMAPRGEEAHAVLDRHGRRWSPSLDHVFGEFLIGSDMYRLGGTAWTNWDSAVRANARLIRLPP